MRSLLVALVVLAAACGDATDSVDEPPATVAAEPVLLAATVDRSDPAPDAPVAGLVTGINDAGFGLWRSQPVEGNLVFSPASIGHATLMARAAADGPTGTAIDAAFGLPAGMAPHQAWNAIDRMITATAGAADEVTVSIADRIWPRIDVTPDQGWVDLLTAEHDTSVEALDFVGDPAGSRDRINGWVSDRTEGLIPDLLPAGFIQGDTVLILTDALYFEAPWDRTFGKYGPVTDVFTHLDGSTTEVEFMQELELGDRRGSGGGFVGAEIPYQGLGFSMLVIVPDAGRFEEVRDRLGQDLLDEIDASFTTGPYELLIPKWTTTTQLDLIPWLTGIGAAPGLYPLITPDAVLDGAVHGADIAVDEWGTVAAAATALAFVESGPPQPELVVDADRPFLYLVRHRESGLVLFAGQVTDPS